ncbi:MAG: hypothetical protein HY851_11390 [candidate division Zixibacteria bacterium]|nr:hypothetical protein [candidate division Zixibacteria bacterium]
MKSTRLQLITLLMALCVVPLASDTTDAREIRCQVLQQKLGRLYFSAGKEEDIFPGCRWVVYRDSTDTLRPLLRGKIAEAYDGVSVSDSGSGTVDLRGTVRILAADTAFDTISVGVSIDRIEATCLIRDSSLIRVIDSRLPLKAGRNVVEIGYLQGDCDRDDQSLMAPAPFLVALLPDVSRPSNRHGILTTALRYKVDTSRLGDIFNFGGLFQPSFLVGNSEIVGFGSDAAKGKQLLQQDRLKGNDIILECQSPSLNFVGRFFRDILAQSGYRTQAAVPGEVADLHLTILPVSIDSPQVSLGAVLSSIARDTVARDKSNQPIRLASRLLEDALQTSDSTQRSQLFQRVDRILQEDIGAFPLFRPIIHICAREEIRGLRLDKDGRIDLRNVYRVKLPPDTVGSAP